MQKQMEKRASQNLEFEKAGELRDRLRAMAFISSGPSGVTPLTFKEGDFAAIHMDGRQGLRAGIFLSGRAKLGAVILISRAIVKTKKPSEILDAFVAQFYLG